MAKSRRKAVRSIYGNLADVDRAMADMIETQAGLRTDEASMNEELTEVRERYEDGIDEARGKLANIEAQIALFCEDHRELFGDKKTLELTHGVVNFRLGTPKTQTLRKWTWKLVLAAIEELGKKFARYLTVKTSVDKAALLKARAAGELTDEQLADFGVEVVQEETFAVAPRYEEASEPVAARQAG